MYFSSPAWFPLVSLKNQRVRFGIGYRNGFMEKPRFGLETVTSLRNIFRWISFMQLRQYRLTWCCWYSGCPLQMLKYCQYKGRLQLRSNNYKLVTILREVDYIGYKFNRAGLYWVGYATVWGINELTSLTFVWRISMTIVAISKQAKLTLTNCAINLLLQSDWWAYWGNVA